jgi:hypothetical protein
MSYTASSINYYRVNANNQALATSSTGVGNAPTEEITAPLASAGLFSSYTSIGGIFTINGNASVDFRAFAIGQYLYYTNTTTGDYVLVGQIDTIAVNGLSLTLTTAAVNNPAASGTPVLSAAYSLITSNESIYMRIATGPVGSPANGRQIPDFGLLKWRQNDNLTGTNLTSQSALERISNVGTPLSNATVIDNIPFTFETQNQFQTAAPSGVLGSATTYFPSIDSFPSFIWILVTPEIGTSTSLSSQTLYRFTTQESTPSIPILQRTSLAKLEGAGYNIAS